MSYLEGVGSVVDVLNWHVMPILCALAVRLTQLEGLCLQSEQHTFSPYLPGYPGGEVPWIVSGHLMVHLIKMY